MLKTPSLVLLTAMITFGFGIPNLLFAQPDKNHCYDHVGDANFCFDTKKKCESHLKDDPVAESPCYHKDLDV